MIYELVESGVAEKTVKWAYLEDERRVFYNGKSKERARPRLVKKITKEGILKPKLTIAGQAESLRMAMKREEAKKGKARMLDEYKLSLAEQNQIASGIHNQVVSILSALSTLKTQTNQTPLPTHIQHKLAQPHPSSSTSTSNSTARGNGRSAPKKDKTYRISDSRLKDFLFEEFARYKYWPLKALVDRLNQPMDHVRKQLSAIADAVTVGPYKGNWTLKPQYAMEMDDSDTEELAPDEQDYSEAVAELVQRVEDGDAIETEMEKMAKLKEQSNGGPRAGAGAGGSGSGKGVDPPTSEAGGDEEDGQDEEDEYGDDDGDDDDDDDDDDDMDEVA